MGATGSIVATISAVKHTVDLVNIIRESAKSLKDAENDLKLAELLGSLAKVKTNVAEIENQLTEKDREIRELKAKLKLQSEVDWQDPFYFKKLENGNLDGPFCQQCHDNDNKLIRLPKTDSPWLTCNTCKSNFENKSYVPVDYSGGYSGGGLNDWMG